MRKGLEEPATGYDMARLEAHDLARRGTGRAPLGGDDALEGHHNEARLNGERGLGASAGHAERFRGAAEQDGASHGVEAD